MKLRLFCALACFGSVSAADLTVGQPGDGADFTDLSSALAAAPVGETIFVLPGTYEGASITQGVSLVGAGSDTTFLTAPSTGGASARHLSVANLPANQQVRVAGFGLAGAAATTPGFGAGVELINNQGSVTLADVWYTPSTAATGFTSDSVEALLHIEACLQVILDKCRMNARKLDDTSADGTYGLNVVSALVFANDSDFVSGGRLGIDGRPGVRLASAELWLNACNLIGEHGETVVSDTPGTPAPAGGAGIAAILGSRIEFFGNQAQLVRGGDGGRVNDSGGTMQAAGDGGPGILMADATTAVASGATALTGGTSPDAVQAPAFVTDASSTLFLLFEPQVGLSVSDTVVSPGESVTLSAGGLSFSPVFVFFGLETIAPLALPSFGGFLQLLPFPPAPLLAIDLNFLGTGEATITIPPEIPPGLPLYFQAANSPASILPSISLPAFVQVGL